MYFISEENSYSLGTIVHVFKCLAVLRSNPKSRLNVNKSSGKEHTRAAEEFVRNKSGLLKVS